MFSHDIAIYRVSLRSQLDAMFVGILVSFIGQREVAEIVEWNLNTCRILSQLKIANNS